jgi:hypothetical protein
MLDALVGLSGVAASYRALKASANRGDRRQVSQVEAVVHQDPSKILFDETGAGRIEALGRVYHAGRFETPTLAQLRARIAPPSALAPLRLTMLLGASPLTDIGALQATAAPGTLFQVASQFNCLEAPGPYLVPVADYFSDYTQGPRASISAFPATLLRQYAAPAADGSRFVQTNERQVELLGDAIPATVAHVQSGYLRSDGVADPAALAAALEANFELIRVGVHDDVEVVLGADWDGEVEGERRIAQVFTSTYASGYSRGGALDVFHEQVCRQLLRAAYLGTLLAAVTLGKRTVVFTAIGGGVFRNPHPLIWESILWATDEVAPLLATPLDVVLNGRDFSVDRGRLQADLRARGGVLVELDRTGLSVDFAE